MISVRRFNLVFFEVLLSFVRAIFSICLTRSLVTDRPFPMLSRVCLGLLLSENLFITTSFSFSDKTMNSSSSTSARFISAIEIVCELDVIR